MILDNNKEAAEEPKAVEEKLDIKDLIVNNFEEIGIYSSTVSPKISIMRIDSFVSYQLFKNKKNKLKSDSYNWIIPELRPTTRRRPAIVDTVIGETFVDNSDFPGVERTNFEVRLNNNEFGAIAVPTEPEIDNRPLEVRLESINREIRNLTSRREIERHRMAVAPDAMARMQANARSSSLTRDIATFTNERNSIETAIREQRANEIVTEVMDGEFDSLYNPIKKKEVILEENKKDLFDNFKSKYNGNPSLVKGYLINSKLYTSNEEIIADNIVITSNIAKYIKVILKVFILNNETNKISYKYIITPLTRIQKTITNKSETILYIPVLVKLRIKSSNASGQIFGLAKEKKGFEGEYLEDWQLETGVVKKLNSNTFYISTPVQKGVKKIKFLLKDCEFINPKLMGYTPPINKTIVINSVVSVKDSKKHNYQLFTEGEEKGIVLAIKANISSKRISKKCNNHRKDMITMKLDNSGRVLTVYAEDLKFIKRKSSETLIKPKKISPYIDLYSNFQSPNMRVERTARENSPRFINPEDMERNNQIWRATQERMREMIERESVNINLNDF